MLYKILLEFSLANFRSRDSFTVLVQTPERANSTVVRQSVIAFRGRGNEVTVLSFPSDLAISLPSIASDEAQEVEISKLSSPQLARETGIITDAQIDTQFPHTFPSKYSVIKLLLRGVIGTEQVSSLKWSDRVSMILYLMLMHSNEYRVVEINPTQRCVDCVEAYLKSTIIPRYLLDTVLTEHATTVGVINQTGINGLAKSVSDIFKAHGFSVVHISSDYGHVDESKIIVTKEAQLLEHEITKIQKLFDTPLKVEVQPSAFTIYRSDIVVVIGNDHWPSSEETAR